ncbi:cathelicidin-1 [Alligator mississippiensis]|uniref:Cathelicidin-1-like n=1 Tax=Alligator mississippiensis TaxID=8496 RepID=A0A151P4T8_ALLMI|nr:cathelicidin-1 [Alligator mississippiensis]KYO44087.1 cathelicidin-1-like [Alligator mississippiensis]UXN85431.1 cathelicidin 3 [Alligator mississippiensis]
MGCRGWGVLLGLATLVAAASASQRKMLTYREAALFAVDFYNRQPGIDHTFQLLSVEPQPVPDTTSKSRQEVRFVVCETVCPQADNHPDSECNIKFNGLVRNCMWLLSTEHKLPTSIITCDTVTPGKHVPANPKLKPGKGPGRHPSSGIWRGQGTPFSLPITKKPVG